MGVGTAHPICSQSRHWESEAFLISGCFLSGKRGVANHRSSIQFTDSCWRTPFWLCEHVSCMSCTASDRYCMYSVVGSTHNEYKYTYILYTTIRSSCPDKHCAKLHTSPEPRFPPFYLHKEVILHGLLGKGEKFLSQLEHSATPILGKMEASSNDGEPPAGSRMPYIPTYGVTEGFLLAEVGTRLKTVNR